MAEITYREEYKRHQLKIESVAPEEKMGELSLSVTARSNWGGDHVLSNAYVLLGEDDVVSLRDALDVCLANIKKRKMQDKADGKITEDKPSVQPKKFRPRKRVGTNTEG